MKKYVGLLMVIVASVSFGVLAFAQALSVDVPAVTNSDFIDFLLKSIGGLRGAQTLTIVAVCLQAVFKLLGTPIFGSVWSKLQPNVKFIVVALLSIASLIVAQLQLGISIGMALMHATVVTALMNYVYNYYERFIEKKDAK